MEHRAVWLGALRAGGVVLALVACTSGPGARRAAPAAAVETFDVILRDGSIYDGSGASPRRADVGIRGDTIAQVGDLSRARGALDLDVAGLAVAPGFINMLSWADESLLVDGRSLSDIHQGVTLEVFGEGTSMGPLNPAMRQRLVSRQTDLRYDVPWTTLGEYLSHLERRGVATNVASFVGATTVREHEIGTHDRPPSAAELAAMTELVRQAMREGALGLGSSLPYVPAVFASTEELIALARAAAEFDGMYISHIRDEGEGLLASIDELLRIVREAGIRGEIYHFKASGKKNWGQAGEAIRKVEAARAAGLPVSADMYPYPASSTGLTYVLPAWVQEGGHEAMIARLKDPAIRQRVIPEMDMIPPEDLLLSSFRNPALRPLIGKSLAEVSARRGTTPEVTALDLIVEDDSRVGTVRFTMSEENVRRNVGLPWVSFCSDAASIAPEPPFTNSQPHPRAYGTFARVLGKYVREEKVISLAEAIRRMTGLPASNLKLDRRGRLEPGFFADVVVFDPATVTDRATFEQPHQLATGVLHVLVNGQVVLRDGAHTGATPGRFVKGPGAQAVVRAAPLPGRPRRVTPTEMDAEVRDAIHLLSLWIQEQIDYNGVPGVALAVVHAGDTVWSAGFGEADLAIGAPVTPRTRFRLGSVSKLFTATAVLQLRDTGKLDLDDPVVEHLPWFRPENPFPDAPPITLRHLLTHTSGLPREGAFPYWTTHEFPTSAEVRASLPTQKLFSRPGEAYRYSNLGVALLGEIVATVSGERWEDYVLRHIAAPLGMTSTTAAPSEREIRTLAGAYRRKLPDGSRRLHTFYETGAFAPAAAVVSTVEDLARFAALQLADGDQPAAGSQILSGATLREMHRVHFVYPSFSGGRGLGFAVSRRDDETFVSHAGWIGGHRAEILLAPANDLAVVALTNADDASPGLFTRQAYATVGRAVLDATAPPPLPAPAPDPSWQIYLGTYTDPWEAEIQVLVLGGKLTLYEHSYPPEEDAGDAVNTLVPVPGAPHSFKMSDGDLVVFELDGAGRVARMKRRYDYFLPKGARSFSGN